MRARRALACAAVTALLAAACRPLGAQEAERTVARTMVSDLAVEVRLTNDERLRLGAGDDERAIALTLMPADAKRWTDRVSTIAAIRPRKALPDTQWVATLTEPGVASGNVTVTRRWRDGKSSWSFFLASKDFEEIRRPLELTEVKALAAAVRRAADELLPKKRSMPRRPRQRRPPPPPKDSRS
jgi:hypothetical protein